MSTCVSSEHLLHWPEFSLKSVIGLATLVNMKRQVPPYPQIYPDKSYHNWNKQLGKPTRACLIELSSVLESPAFTGSVWLQYFGTCSVETNVSCHCYWLGRAVNDKTHLFLDHADHDIPGVAYPWKYICADDLECGSNATAKEEWRRSHCSICLGTNTAYIGPGPTRS